MTDLLGADIHRRNGHRIGSPMTSIKKSREQRDSARESGSRGREEVRLLVDSGGEYDDNADVTSQKRWLVKHTTGVAHRREG